MAQVVSETQPELPPVQKYMQAMAVCNSLALLASQNAMVLFVQRLTLLKKLQTCWTKGCEVQIIIPEGSEPDLEGEAVGIDGVIDEIDVKLEPDLARVISQQLPRVSLPENGESSDETVVDEPLACSVVLCDDTDVLKAEMEVVEEELPVAKKTTKMGLRSKAKSQEKEEKVVPKRKRGRPVKPKKTAEAKDLIEKRPRKETKEETVEDPESTAFSFLCSVCKEAFATFVQLKEHKADAHGPSTGTLSVAPNTGTMSVAQSRRRVSLHTKTKKSLDCSVCDRSFPYLYMLKRHLVVHTGDRPFMCSHCGMRFTKKDVLNSHLRVHSGEKPYKCGECGLQFIQASNLTYHIRSRHTDEKPFVCTECGSQFRQSTLLKYHMRKHTGERPLVCPLCDRRFARPTELREHRKLHSDAKTYVCRDCGKTFRLHSTLNKHRKIHWDVKPHKCSECERMFTQLYNLKTHMRTHTGQKPYACEQCGKVFAHQGTLKKHFEVHSTIKH